MGLEEEWADGGLDFWERELEIMDLIVLCRLWRTLNTEYYFRY